MYVGWNENLRTIRSRFDSKGSRFLALPKILGSICLGQPLFASGGEVCLHHFRRSSLRGTRDASPYDHHCRYDVHCVGGALCSRHGPGESKRREQAHEALRTLQNAAQQTYEATASSYEAGTSKSSEVYDWSRKCAAEIMKAMNQEQALQASTEHLERMRKLHKKVKALHDEGSRGGEMSVYHASRFYVAEAELMLMETDGEKIAGRDRF